MPARTTGTIKTRPTSIAKRTRRGLLRWTFGMNPIFGVRARSADRRASGLGYLIMSAECRTAADGRLISRWAQGPAVPFEGPWRRAWSPSARDRQEAASPPPPCAAYRRAGAPLRGAGAGRILEGGGYFARLHGEVPSLPPSSP